MKSIILIFVTLSCASLIASDLVFLNADATKTCPKYSCNSGLETDVCAKASGKFSDGTRTVGVKVCSDNKICKTLQTNNFQDDNETTGKCEASTSQTVKYLPGEACTKDEECQDVTWYDADKKEQTKGSCDTTNKVCKGSAIDAQCTDNNSCVVGSYCKAKKCTAQVELGKACESTYDCKNNLFCNKKQCTEVFSLEVGTSLADADAFGKAYACKTALYDPMATEPKCQEKRYKLSENQKNDSGRVTCDFGSKCTYQIFESTAADAKAVGNDSTQDCQCGFNDLGTGFCPYSQSSTDSTLKSIDTLKATFDNKRHTQNRASGNIVKTDSEKCAGISNSILFAKAPQCVIDALGYVGCSNAFYLASSFLFMIILALF